MSQEQPVIAEEAASDPDLSGKRLGDFHLLRRLGHGAMAEVYLAEQSSLQRQVAVKVLRSTLASDETFVQRFHNEARAAASLVHANIVQIHEVGHVDNIHYIAQEYVQGQNLREFLSRHGPPSGVTASQIMRQVASALNRAGERGLVHRDIKPENIMLSHTGEVKVTDFGLARLKNDEAASKLTQVGITMGTPLYMSPEQVQGKALDPRSDIYSLGVTCYHMLSGAPPFRGDTALAVAVQHMKTPPDRLESLRSDLPVALCRIVHKMLAKDPGQRYQTAQDLLRDLRAASPADEGDAAWDDLHGIDALRERVESTERLGTLMKTSSMLAQRRTRAGVWAAIIALAFLAGGAAAWWTRPTDLLASVTPAEPPKLESAAAQLLAAHKTEDFVEREALLKGVERHFASNQPAVRTAQRELAYLYLRENRLDDAARQFRLLTGAESDPQLQAVGFAGQSYVFSLQRQQTDAAEMGERLRQLLTKSPAAVEGLDTHGRSIVSFVLNENSRVDSSNGAK